MSKPILDIIAVTYNHNHELKCFVESILAQSVREWRLTVVHDGPSDKFDSIMDELEVSCHYDGRISSWSTSERHNDWGHSLRAMSINGLGDSKYTLITNCDNYYMPVFVKEMCQYDEDIVFCNMVHNHWGYQVRESELRRRAVDCGNVVIKTELVKKVGWNHFDYAADWHFIEDCLKTGATSRKINKVLFVHN